MSPAFFFFSFFFCLVQLCWRKERSFRQRCGGHSIAGSQGGAGCKCENRKGVGRPEATKRCGEWSCAGRTLK